MAAKGHGNLCGPQILWISLARPHGQTRPKKGNIRETFKNSHLSPAKLIWVSLFLIKIDFNFPRTQLFNARFPRTEFEPTKSELSGKDNFKLKLILRISGCLGDCRSRLSLGAWQIELRRLGAMATTTLATRATSEELSRGPCPGRNINAIKSESKSSLASASALISVSSNLSPVNASACW